MKLKGLIREVKLYIERLKAKGFYVSEDLVRHLLKDLGEL